MSFGGLEYLGTAVLGVVLFFGVLLYFAIKLRGFGVKEGDACPWCSEGKVIRVSYDSPFALAPEGSSAAVRHHLICGVCGVHIKKVR